MNPPADSNSGYYPLPQGLISPKQKSMVKERILAGERERWNSGDHIVVAAAAPSAGDVADADAGDLMMSPERRVAEMMPAPPTSTST